MDLTRNAVFMWKKTISYSFQNASKFTFRSTQRDSEIHQFGPSTHNARTKKKKNFKCIVISRKQTFSLRPHRHRPRKTLCCAKTIFFSRDLHLTAGRTLSKTNRRCDRAGTWSLRYYRYDMAGASVTWWSGRVCRTTANNNIFLRPASDAVTARRGTHLRARTLAVGRGTDTREARRKLATWQGCEKKKTMRNGGDNRDHTREILLSVQTIMLLK